jgi:hypothetical protein
MAPVDTRCLQLVKGVPHRGGGIIAVGRLPCALSSPLWSDEPSVDAEPVGVDPDGVAGGPEPVTCSLLDSYCTGAMLEIVA